MNTAHRTEADEVAAIQPPDALNSIDVQLNNLRSSISEVGHQVDSCKAKTGAALGGGVFLMLLAVVAAYDLVAGKSEVWLTRGVTREALVWTAGALGVSALILLALGFVRVRRRNGNLEAELEKMEQEYAELLERKDQVSRSRP